jgi:N-methylhydantoinase A
VLLGYVDPNSFLGGEFKLDAQAAADAVEEHLAKPLGVTALEAAWTVRVVANALMAQAMRLMTVERGFDPRELSYMCYGGAGPVHAIDLAEELEIKEVIVPPLPGLFSAFGMIVADRQFDGQTAVETELEAITAPDIATLCAELRQQALETFGAQQHSESVQTQFRADCRYTGQPASISVDIPANLLDASAQHALIATIRAGFETNHKRMWNFTKPNQPIVLVNLRVQASVRTGWRGVVQQSTAHNAAHVAQRSREVYVDGRMQALPTYQRAHLAPLAVIEGPAIIEEQSSCLIFKAGQTARIDAVGNLRISL